MSRPLIAFAAAAAAVVAPGADACSCIGHPTRAEADAAGERAYAAADLIVEGTPGNKPADYRRICFGPGNAPRPGDYGRRISMIRPFVVHRVLKGRPPARPLLAAAPAEVTRHGCGILTSSCDVPAPANVRHVMILRRVEGGRYQPISLCEQMALRNSRRGQALFKRAG